MCSAAVRAEDTLYSDNDEFRTVRDTDPSGIATEKDKRAGSDCLDRLTALFIFIYR